MSAKPHAPKPDQLAELEEIADQVVGRRGLRAILRERDDGSALAVRAPGGELILEVREVEGAIQLILPSGDLELRAREGRVLIHGERGVELSGPTVTVKAGRLRQLVGTLETKATKIVEKAKDAYRDIEGLHQLRAEDVRTVAKRTVRTIAERVRTKADQDVKIDADQIYLG